MSIETPQRDLPPVQTQVRYRDFVHAYGPTLGNESVMASHDVARNNLESEPGVHTIWDENMFRHEQALAYDQEQLRSLAPEEYTLFAKFLAKSKIPKSILVMNGLKNRTILTMNRVKNVEALLTKFTEADLVDPTAREQFTNFLQWHNHMLVEKQKTFDKERLPVHMQRFEDRLAAKVAVGDESETALTKFREFKDGKRELEIFMDDGLSTFSRDIEGHSLLRLGGGAEIAISPLSRLEDSVLSHELFHILEGNDYPGDNDSEEQDQRLYVPREHLGMYRLFGGGLGGSAMNEAVTEHRADSLIHGHIDIINPSNSKRRHSRAYVSERTLLDTLASYGLRKVDVRLFARAASSDESEDQEILAQALERAWPKMDIVNRIKDLEPHEGKEDGEVIEAFSQKIRLEATSRKQQLGRIGRLARAKATV